MYELHQIIQQRQQLKTWFATDLGQQVLQQEMQAVQKLSQQVLKHVILQIGAFADTGIELWPDVGLMVSLDVVTDAHPAMNKLSAEPELLPLANQSVNLVVMPHALDFAVDAHEVLREVSRVITPEGHVIITGFNPASFWGLRKLFSRRSSGMPWRGHFYRSHQVQDWLTLLGFELMGGSMCCYQPPIHKPAIRLHLDFLQAMGDRWWPMLAGVYVLVARKRELGGRPILRGQRWRRRWRPGVAQPAASISSELKL